MKEFFFLKLSNPPLLLEKVIVLPLYETNKLPRSFNPELPHPSEKNIDSAAFSGVVVNVLLLRHDIMKCSVRC